MEANITPNEFGETLEPDEERLIAEIARLSVRLMKQASAVEGKPVRMAHPKQHGCLRAEFIVEHPPESLRHGVFAHPRTFSAWVRFSSASPVEKPDGVPDARGISIKLLDVAGPKLLDDEADATTQDFLLVTSPVFFIRNLRDYARFFRLPLFLRPLYFLMPWHWKEVAIVRRGLTTPENLLRIPYWSTTPYRLGPHAVKYMVRPHDPESPASGRRNLPADGLTRSMAETLSRGDASFDFLVQLRTDPLEMPIEDSTVPWDETLSPWQKVATLRIPQQTFTSEERRTFGQNLSFTPWHALPEHRPLGGINRARKEAYLQVSRRRHELTATHSEH